MIKNMLSFLFILCMGGLPAQNTLFISELADPGDEWTGRFVELNNASGSAIDFDTADWYLSKQSNGGAT